MGSPDNLDLNLEKMQEAIRKAEQAEAERLRQIEQEAREQ